MAKSKWDMNAIKTIAGRGLTVTMSSGGAVDVSTLHPTDIRNDSPGDFCDHQPEKQNKFRNTIVKIDGFKFRSKLEGNRYLQLKMMRTAGLIEGFRKQVPFDLYVNEVYITRYIADFVVTYPDGVVTVEDTKGVETEAFRIKKHLMLATLGIEIQIIRNIKSNNNGNIKKSNRKSAGRRTRSR